MCSSILTANGQEAPDKSTYTLFNPTPPADLREISTDRPDQTESPYTVDAGHIQVEIDFANATFDREGEMRVNAWSIAPVNLKVGVLNNVDVQFMIDTYAHSRVEDRAAGTVDKASGLGDIATRIKVKVWGNDGDRTALAVMPFVKWPLAESDLRNGETEGGVIVPLGMALPGGWDMGLMAEIDLVADDAGGHDTEYFNTITVSHDIDGGLGGYLEFAALISPERDEDWQGQVDAGLTYGVDESTPFDIGRNFGVTDSAPDLNPFVGLSRRF